MRGIHRIGYTIDGFLCKRRGFYACDLSALTFDHEHIGRRGDIEPNGISLTVCRESTKVEHEIRGGSLNLQRRRNTIGIAMTENEIIAAVSEHACLKGRAAIPTIALRGLPSFRDLHALNLAFFISCDRGDHGNVTARVADRFIEGDERVCKRDIVNRFLGNLV